MNPDTHSPVKLGRQDEYTSTFGRRRCRGGSHSIVTVMIAAIALMCMMPQAHAQDGGRMIQLRTDTPTLETVRSQLQKEMSEQIPGARKPTLTAPAFSTTGTEIETTGTENEPFEPAGL